MQPARTIEHIQVQLESSGAVYVHTRLDAGARVELGAENSQMREYRDATLELLQFSWCGLLFGSFVGDSILK